MHISRVCLHTLIRDPLGPGSLVLDCGVNKAKFSRWVAENIGCEVHGFEPDPRLFAMLPVLPRCTFHQNALAAEAGVLRLHLGTDLCSSLHYSEGDAAESVDVRALTLPEFCAEQQIDRIDLLKLDIEGEEVPILLQLDDDFIQSTISQMTVEFHDHKDPAAIPLIRRIMSRMRELGFFVISLSYFTYGDVLFVNRAHFPVGRLAAAELGLRKYASGLGRFGRRIGQRAFGIPLVHEGRRDG